MTKRRISFLSLALIVIMSALLLSSCYVVKSGSMSKIEGTYVLTGYSGKGDYLTERGIVMYLVIRSDGTGYYAYKDNNTQAYITELRCRYVQDTEEAGKYSYVEIDFGTGEYVKFAVYAPTFEIQTNLNFTRPVWKPVVWGEPLEIDYNINVDFARVSRKTDLSYINENFGSAPSLPFGTKRFDGTYKLDTIVANEKTPVGAVIPENQYVYYYIDLDFVAGKVKIYAMSKSDEMKNIVELSDLTIALVDGEYVIGYLGMADVMRMNVQYSSFYLEGEEYYGGNCFTLRFYQIGDLTEEQIADSIEDDINVYLNSKLPHEE